MDWACDRVYTFSRMGKSVKCNSRSSDSITKGCYVITIVSLFQINNFTIRGSIFEERQKYTGSVHSTFPLFWTIFLSYRRSYPFTTSRLIVYRNSRSNLCLEEWTLAIRIPYQSQGSLTYRMWYRKWLLKMRHYWTVEVSVLIDWIGSGASWPDVFPAISSNSPNLDLYLDDPSSFFSIPTFDLSVVNPLVMEAVIDDE